MLDESGGGWTAIAQKDGRLLGDQDTEDIAREGERLFEHAFGHGAATLAVDGERSGSPRIPAPLSRLGVRHLALAPLATLRSRLGVLFIGREEARPLSDDDQMVLTTVANQSAIPRLIQTNKIAMVATAATPAPTGLPNR